MKPILATMLSVSGLQLTDFEKRLLSSVNPMGVTLFKRNIQNKQQVQALVQSVKEIIGREDVLIAVDQEGGRVCRLSEPNWLPYLSQYSLGSLSGKEGKELTKLHGELIATDLNELGINWNYAPVLDVAYANTTEALKNRTFSSDCKLVSSLGKILVDTYTKNGICPCIKHLPGHGRAIVDPHLNLPILSQSLKELENDFYPFISAGQSAPAGMTAHVVLSEIDNRPVTQSKKAIQQIIRDKIGFQGFLISDAIEMHALKGSLSSRTKNGLDAGCDAIMYSQGEADALQEVVSAARPLTDAALERFDKIRQVILQKILKTETQSARTRYNELAKKTQSLSTDYDAVEILNKMKGNK